MKKIILINLTLIFLIIIMGINLISFSGLTGKAVSLFDLQPKCIFENEQELRIIPMEFCCFELQSQLNCEKSVENLLENSLQNYECYTSKDSPRKYLINQDTLYYCQGAGYEIKVN